MAEATNFIHNPGGDDLQYVAHADMPTREGPINPGPLQDVHLVSSSYVNPTFSVGSHYRMGLRWPEPRAKGRVADGIPIPSSSGAFT